jgi:hypothetical protein
VDGSEWGDSLHWIDIINGPKLGFICTNYLRTQQSASDPNTAAAHILDGSFGGIADFTTGLVNVVILIFHLAWLD